MKHNHSTEQVLSELWVKLFAWLPPRIYGHITQGYAAGLIDFFQAINQRPSLYRDSPCVISYARIRLNYLGRDF
jgi:hypothetical protein